MRIKPMDLGTEHNDIKISRPILMFDDPASVHSFNYLTNEIVYVHVVSNEVL